MRTKLVLATVMAALVILAGCSTGFSDGTTAGPSTDEPTLEPTETSDSEYGTVNFYVSDERNDIEDFQSLSVTIDRIGFQRGGENGSWIERDIDNQSVDLTRLQGPNATLVNTSRLPTGNYTTVFAYVTAINGTLTSGESANVKLPSEKLQLQVPFTVQANDSVDFVFDITVIKAGQSGKYILKPVISESGPDVELTDVDDDRDDESISEALAVSLVSVNESNNTVTIEVTRNGSVVANASVWQEDEQVGETNADGRITVSLPTDEEELELEIRKGDAEGEFEYERESDDREGDEAAEDDRENDETDDDDRENDEADGNTTDQ